MAEANDQTQIAQALNIIDDLINKTDTTKHTVHNGQNDDVKADNRIYKIRRPRTSWVLFNAYTSVDLLTSHPTATLGERTQIASKAWHTLNAKDRKKWDDKCKKETEEYERIGEDFKQHNDWNKVPKRWKQIDQRAERERRVKNEANECDDEKKNVDHELIKDPHKLTDEDWQNKVTNSYQILKF